MFSEEMRFKIKHLSECDRRSSGNKINDLIFLCGQYQMTRGQDVGTSARGGVWASRQAQCFLSFCWLSNFSVQSV